MMVEHRYLVGIQASCKARNNTPRGHRRHLNNRHINPNRPCSQLIFSHCSKDSTGSRLVGTGNGAAPPEASEADGQESGLKAPDFLEAVDLILKDPAPPGRS